MLTANLAMVSIRHISMDHKRLMVNIKLDLYTRGRRNDRMITSKRTFPFFRVLQALWS
jgi:hypothetical protein